MAGRWNRIARTWEAEKKVLTREVGGVREPDNIGPEALVILNSV